VPTEQTFCTASSEELDPGGNGEPPQRVSGLLAPIYNWFTEGSTHRTCGRPRRCSRSWGDGCGHP